MMNGLSLELKKDKAARYLAGVCGASRNDCTLGRRQCQRCAFSEIRLAHGAL